MPKDVGTDSKTSKPLQRRLRAQLFLEVLRIAFCFSLTPLTTWAFSPHDATIGVPFLPFQPERSELTGSKVIGLAFDLSVSKIRTELESGERSERVNVPGYSVYSGWNLSKGFRLFVEATGTRFIFPVIPTRGSIQYELLESGSLRASILAGTYVWSPSSNSSLGVALYAPLFHENIVPFTAIEWGRDFVFIEEASDSGDHVLFHTLLREKTSLLIGTDVFFQLQRDDVSFRIFAGFSRFAGLSSNFGSAKVRTNDIESVAVVYGMRFAIHFGGENTGIRSD